MDAPAEQSTDATAVTRGASPGSRRAPLRVFLLAALVYAIFAYGGVRSPDSEVAFRTAEALALRGEPGVDRPLETWPTFAGFQRGRDGRFYSVFGPAEPYAMSPFLPIATRINETGWYRALGEHVPISHYVGKSMMAIQTRTPPVDFAPHALRLLMSPFNVVVSALGAAVFFLLARALSGSPRGAGYATLAFAFGSLALPYSGTFCNEPLTTLFVLLCAWFLVDPAFGAAPDDRSRRTGIFGAGLFAGLAVASHITSVLFLPFLGLFVLSPMLGKKRALRSVVADAACLVAGAALIGSLMALYNHARFGSFLETGRSTGSMHTDEIQFVGPWHGLHYLLTSAGKGMLWHRPEVLLGLLAWPAFHRRHRAFSFMTGAALVFRVLFLASFFWKCGFCLGPRYLVSAAPLLLLPIATWAARLVETRDHRRLAALAVALVACTAQQLFFALGEPFIFQHRVRNAYVMQRINPFHDDAMFLDWHHTPVLSLLEGDRGPFLLKFVPLGNYALWAACSALAAAFVALWHLRGRAASDA